LDVLRCVHHFLPWFPSFVTENYPAAKRTVAVGLSGLVGLILLAGYINSLLPAVRTLNISINKKAGDLKTLDIVMASDIHLGTIVGRSRLSGIVDRINSLNPDVVLLPGDIVDEDISNPKKSSLGEPLKNIRSRYGVFAATGNHEYIAGILDAIAFLEAQNIKLLQDQTVKVSDSFYLIGRKDSSATRFGGTGRKEVDELMRSIDTTYPVILMDHQPFRLAEAAEAGVDLQISGHTHNGQLWPINYIVGSIFELAWGYKKIGDTHFYVSDGVGTWGPPVRIGNRPEIVQIHLQFK
ncbi:MAG: metallophosphoesterase, partial [Acidobacteriota bacterium]